MYEDLLATLITGQNDFGGQPPTIEKRGNGVRGRRDYWVNCTDHEVAMTAPGLPAIDEAWSAEKPTLLCIGMSAEYVGGCGNPLTGTGGVSLVRVEFETADLNGRLPSPRRHERYCLIDGESTQLQRYYDARGLYPDPDFVGPPGPELLRPINNGRGVSVEFGKTVVEVVWYPEEEQITALMTQLINLRRVKAVNLDGFTLPKIMHTAYRIAVEPGQARYLDFSISPPPQGGADDEGSLLELRQRVEIAPDHLHRWALEDDLGNAILPVLTNHIYPRMTFGGIFGPS